MPSNTVGGVSVKVRLDDRDALKQLESLRAKINALDAKLNEKRQQRSAIAEQMDEASARADAARQRVQQLQEALEKASEKQREAREGVEITRDLIREQERIIGSGNLKLANGDLSAAEWTQTQEAIGIAEAKLKEYNLDLKAGEALLKSSTAAVKEQEKQVSRETSEYQKIVNEVDALRKKLSAADQEIAAGEQDLAKMQEQAANLERQVVAGESAMAKLERSSGAAAQRMSKSFERLGRMIRRVFVFTVILGALRQLREYINSVLMSTPEFSEAFAQLRGALLTLVQPIIQWVIPVLTRLVQIITQVVTAIATLVSQLFGKTLSASKQSAAALYDQAKAYKATGSAAKKAANQVAAFDQLNILQDQTSGGSAVGGAGSVAPSFDFEELPTDQFEELLDIIAAIGAALLGWKISSMFGLGLQGAIGLAMILFGTFKLIQGYLDAWQNGVDLSNLLDMLGGLTIAALGAYLAFGSMGAGIALVIGGLALLGLGFKDAMENGLNLANTLLIIAGLLALGIGIGLLTGMWIPLLIAGIAGALLALVYFTGHGDELMQGLRDTFEGFAKFVSGVFSGDMETALDGINQMGLGMEETFLSVIESMEDGFTNMFDTLNRLTNGVFAPILDYWKSEFESTITFWKDSLNGFNVFLEGVFTGDWEKAWYGLKMVVSSIINRVLEMIENAANGVVDTLNLLPFFDIQRVKLPRVDLTGGTQSGGQRGSGGRANTGAFRGKADRAIEENTKETTENTGSILEGVNDILKEMHTQTGLGSLQRNAANAYWERVPGVASGTVLPRSQAFINSGIDPAMNSVYDMGQLSDTIVQMTNQILSAIQNQEFATYLDGKKVSQQLYSPMQAVARTRGSALVKG